MVQNSQAAAENYPVCTAFCTVELNFGQVPVPDAKLTRLAAIYGYQSVVPHALEFVDIAGLVVGASEGAGLGNKFLSNIRGVNAILHMLRCYAPNRDDLIHVEGRVDPVADAHLVNTELALSDLGQVEKRMQRLKSGKPLKSKLASINPAAAAAAKEAELAVPGKLVGLLEEGIGARNARLEEEELALLWELDLLTAKPTFGVRGEGGRRGRGGGQGRG